MSAQRLAIGRAAQSSLVLSAGCYRRERRCTLEGSLCRSESKRATGRENQVAVQGKNKTAKSDDFFFRSSVQFSFFSSRVSPVDEPKHSLCRCCSATMIRVPVAAALTARRCLKIALGFPQGLAERMARW